MCKDTEDHFISRCKRVRMRGILTARHWHSRALFSTPETEEAVLVWVPGKVIFRKGRILAEEEKACEDTTEGLPRKCFWWSCIIPTIGKKKSHNVSCSCSFSSVGAVSAFQHPLHRAQSTGSALVSLSGKCRTQGAFPRWTKPVYTDNKVRTGLGVSSCGCATHKWPRES